MNFAGGTSTHGVKAYHLFDAAPTFDADSGAHRCVVKRKPVNDDAALLEAVSKIDAAVVLTASGGDGALASG